MAENNKIQVSVICTAFNHYNYIAKALEGFIIQKTNFPFAVFVHNDASIDKTAEIIMKYANKYPDIIKPIIETENQHSQGIKIKNIIEPYVHGKYIALCEGDDCWIDPYKLQKQYDFLENHPDYSLCATGAIWHDIEKKIDKKQFIIKKDIDIPVESIIAEKKGRIFPTVSIMTKKEIYYNNPSWKIGVPIGDTPLFIDAGLHGKIRMLKDVTCVYNYGTSGSWTKRVNQTEAYFEFCRKFENMFIQLDTFTKRKYKKAVQYRLKSIKFNEIALRKDFKTLFSREFSEVMRNKPVRTKISYFLQYRFKWLYKLLIRNDK